MSRVRRFITGLVVFILVLGLALGALVAISVPRSFPETTGEIQATGLDGPVEILRDDYGVPHIYAATSHDLFFAQGYVHAQDRFWQMDFWRHQGAGRLSELMGDALLDTDLFLRTLGWERVAREELAALPPETRAILEAYAEGVNAYLADHQGTAVSLEYLFLPLANPGYAPQLWKPLNTMTWTKAMAWELRGNMGHEIDRAMLLKTLSPALLDQLFPFYPEDRPVIVPDPHVTGASQPQEADFAALNSAAAPALAEIQARFTAVDANYGPGLQGIGSNSWAISGDLTATGMPLLANDPHLALMVPSIWYEIGLHCTPKGPDCPFEVTGFSFAGTPGVVIGHNDQIGWTMTNVGPDVMDLYIEKINPANPNQYEFEGTWHDMEIVTEVIQVSGGEPQELEVRLTRHGPVISEVYGSPLDELKEESALDFPEAYAISLQWTALEPGTTFEAIIGFNRAQNWEEFRAAASQFVVPAQNLVYADAAGNIGYQMPGRIPIRNAGHTGLLPVPGWTGEYEWQGLIPFEDQPFAFNPPSGYIVTANNAVVGPEYPYTISRYWAYGQRAQTILDRVQNAPGPIDIPYIQQMQGDNRNVNAEVLVPLLLQLPLADEGQAAARELLAGWDYQNDMDSAPAALFEAFWKHLAIRTFEDDLPEFYPPDNGIIWREAVRQLVKTRDDPLWDDQATTGTERRDDIFQAAFADAVAELSEKLGSNPADWAWGELHTITFRHQVMDSFPLIRGLFNRGPFATAGGEGIVNATGWGTDWSYEVDWVPSMRMIVDFGDLDNSLTMHTTGQSGHAYEPHYIDMADPWRNIEYHPMRWSRAQVEAGADGILRLVP
jgi:penicillin amidase